MYIDNSIGTNLDKNRKTLSLIGQALNNKGEASI